MRDLRDSLVHSDALTLVFPAEPGIEFQVYKRYRKLINDDRLAVHENTVRFEGFAAAVMSRLWELTEDISIEIADRHGLEPLEGAYSLHWGLGVLKGWTVDLSRAG